MATDFEIVFKALENAGVRYLTVGGVAVVLHGVPRFTADLDLVIALDGPNLRAAIDALSKLGFRPRAPVPFSALEDPATRASWVRDKGLTVLSVWSNNHPLTDVDIFVESPFDFESLYSRAIRVPVGDVAVSVIAKEDLIAMKAAVGRPKDAEDVRTLSQGTEVGDG